MRPCDYLLPVLLHGYECGVCCECHVRNVLLKHDLNYSKNQQLCNVYRCQHTANALGDTIYAASVECVARFVTCIIILLVNISL